MDFNGGTPNFNVDTVGFDDCYGTLTGIHFEYMLTLVEPAFCDHYLGHGHEIPFTFIAFCNLHVESGLFFHLGGGWLVFRTPREGTTDQS